MKNKNLIFGIFLLGVYPTLFAQTVTIPDAAFKAKLLSHTPAIDTNNDNEIQITEAESYTGMLDVKGSSAQSGGITDVTGLEAFINITGFNCRWNDLTTLDTSSNLALQTIICYSNEIINIDVSANVQLIELGISDNQLTAIDISNNVNLEVFTGSFNSFTSIDFSNNIALESIECYFCELDSVTLGVLPNVDFLLLPNNNLVDLNISGLGVLSVLNVRFNDLETLNTSQNTLLEIATIHDNNLISLDFNANEILHDLECHNNIALETINLINGNNHNFDTSTNSSSNFTNLPLLHTVCLDDAESDLANFILDQVAHEVTFLETCNLGITIEQQPIISIYPNPVNDFLNLVNSDAILEYVLCDAHGSILIENNRAEKINKRMDVSFLAKGFYFMTIRTLDGNSTTLKVIKK